jgi:hypothetical protein
VVTGQTNQVSEQTGEEWSMVACICGAVASSACLSTRYHGMHGTATAGNFTFLAIFSGVSKKNDDIIMHVRIFLSTLGLCSSPLQAGGILRVHHSKPSI